MIGTNYSSLQAWRDAARQSERKPGKPAKPAKVAVIQGSRTIAAVRSLYKPGQ